MVQLHHISLDATTGRGHVEFRFIIYFHIMVMTAVVALTRQGGMGTDSGQLPWHPTRLHFDMAFLSLVTTNGYKIMDDGFTINDHDNGNAVVMGRRTFESLPKPLSNRRNIVLTRNTIDNIETARGLSEAIQMAHAQDLFILGGKAVYEEAMEGKVPFLVTQFKEQPDSVRADVYLDTSRLASNYAVHDITMQAYHELVRLKPALANKGQLVDGVIVEGEFKYSILYYYSE